MMVFLVTGQCCKFEGNFELLLYFIQFLGSPEGNQ